MDADTNNSSSENSEIEWRKDSLDDFCKHKLCGGIDESLEKANSITCTDTFAKSDKKADENVNESGNESFPATIFRACTDISNQLTTSGGSLDISKQLKVKADINGTELEVENIASENDDTFPESVFISDKKNDMGRTQLKVDNLLDTFSKSETKSVMTGARQKVTSPQNSVTTVCESCCDENGDGELAQGFCVTCIEYLCSSCCLYHRRNKHSRYHVILQESDMPDDITPYQKIKDLINCQSHPDKQVAFLCFDHLLLICNTCIVSSHKTCENVKEIESEDNSNSYTDIKITVNKEKVDHLVDKILLSKNERLNELQKQHSDINDKCKETGELLKQTIDSQVKTLI